jgi:uncharacterized membrane protein
VAGSEFRVCGGATLSFEDPGGRLAPFRKQFGSSAPLFVEVMAIEEGKRLVLDSVRRVSTELTGCAEDLGRAKWRAFATEPSWNVDVFPDGMAFRAADAGGVAFPQVTTRSVASGQAFESAGGTRRLLLTLHETRCVDRATGFTFAYTAEAVLDKKVYRGCAIEK